MFIEQNIFWLMLSSKSFFNLTNYLALNKSGTEEALAFYTGRTGSSNIVKNGDLGFYLKTAFRR
jgi:hypothetical protein